MHGEALNQLLGRRSLLTAGALVGAAAALGACNSLEQERPYTDTPEVHHGVTTGPEPTPKPGITSVYLPTWYTPAQYANVAKNLRPAAAHINRIHLAYATPNPSGGIDMNVPKLPRSISELLKADLFKDTGLSIAVGGPETTVAAWSAAFADTAHFGRNVRDLINRLEQAFARTVHLDLNIGVRAQDSQEITNLVRASRMAIEGISSSTTHELSMLVEPFLVVDQLDTGQDGLTSLVNTFRLATYGKNGPWSPKAGPIADIKWTNDALFQWSSKIAGEVDKLQVGFASYGYHFPDAAYAGDDFKRPKDTSGLLIPYNQIPKASIKDDGVSLTSSGKIGNDYVSCMSPNVIAQQAAEIRGKYPRIGGWFFWAADGLTAGHITAVQV